MIFFRTKNGPKIKFKQNLTKNDYQGDNAYSNSDIFPALLSRAVAKNFPKKTYYKAELEQISTVKIIPVGRGFMVDVFLDIPVQGERGLK